MAVSLSKRNSARALASSVLPTPVGPRNRNEPIGRFGSCSPARLRRTASATACTAASWSTIRRWIWSSSFSSFSRSVVSIRASGMPVHWLTTSAISSESTSFLSRRWPPLAGWPSPIGLGLGDPLLERLALGVEGGQGLELPLVGPLAPLLHVADLIPGPAVLGLHRLQPLADLLDVAQAGLLHLPLAAEVLELLLDLLDLQLDLGEPLAGVLLLLVAEHPLGQLQLQQPALEDVDLGGDRLQLHRQPAARLVDQVDRLVGQEPVGDVPRRPAWRRSPAPSPGS